MTIRPRPPKQRGLGHVRSALRFAGAGLRFAWRHENAFRQEVVVAGLAAVVALLLPVSWASQAQLLGALILVLGAELANTALEQLCDAIFPDFDQRAKRVKDLGSALVLVAILHAAVVWFFILIDLWW